MLFQELLQVSSLEITTVSARSPAIGTSADASRTEIIATSAGKSLQKWEEMAGRDPRAAIRAGRMAILAGGLAIRTGRVIHFISDGRGPIFWGQEMEFPMHINRRYDLPTSTVNFLSSKLPSLQASRLVHGLLCQIEMSCKGLAAAGPLLTKEQTIWIGDIADLTAAQGCRDHRWIDKGIADLAGGNVFRKIERKDPKRIEFLFQDRIRETFTSNKEKHGFAKMQTSDLAGAITGEEALIMMLVRLFEGRDWPSFKLPFNAIPTNHRISLSGIEDRDSVEGHGCDATANAPDWLSVKRRWCRAIERVAGKLGHSFLIAPCRGPLDQKVSQVWVKIQHAGTDWQPERLYKFGAAAGRVIQVMPGTAHRSLNDQELRARLQSTVIY